MHTSSSIEKASDSASSDSCCDSPRQRLDLTEKQAVQKLQYLDQWTILEEKGVRKLSKSYVLSFKNAVQFAHEIAFICDEFNHHPELEIKWNSIAIKWFTQTAGGLTDLDFASAEACDSIFETLSSKV